VALRVAEHAELSDRGRHRELNEDAYVVNPPYFAVADGMGGAQAGEVASRLAADAVREHRPNLPPEERLAAIAREANRRIYSLAARDERRRGMGTTLTAALVDGDEVAIGHVGDSRAYRWRDGRLEQLTRDHSLVAELQRSGQLTPEAAEQHPQRSVITRALGPEADVEVDTYTVPARAGDVFLLCSDGLTTMLSDDEIAAILERARDLEDAAQTLVRAANQSGGRDNITVILFRLEDAEDEDPNAERVDNETTVSRTASRTSAPDETIPGTLAAPPVNMAPGRQAGTSARATGPQVPSPSGHRVRYERAVRLQRSARRIGALLAVCTILVAGVIGARQALRSVYFIGTDESGLITLYRGLPYELPLGIRLYETEYVSGMPARALSEQRRAAVLDHTLRSRRDAVDLVRAIENGRIEGLRSP